MNKPKFSLKKALKTVEVSSKIEGHKIPRTKSTSKRHTKSKIKL